MCYYCDLSHSVDVLCLLELLQLSELLELLVPSKVVMYAMMAAPQRPPGASPPADNSRALDVAPEGGKGERRRKATGTSLLVRSLFPETWIWADLNGSQRLDQVEKRDMFVTD